MALSTAFDRNFDAGVTPLRLLGQVGVCMEKAADRTVLRVEAEALRGLAREAFTDLNFLFRTRRLEQWAGILDDPAASANDRLVAAALLKNATIAAEGVLPTCQDTGTATVVAFKGEAVCTGSDDAAALAAGAGAAYASAALRASQMAPLSMFAEQNTGTNLPAQIDIFAVPGGEYRFLFLAKGGGSSNKTALFQQTKALLNEAALVAFLREKVRALGVAACPPYNLALVVGGPSPEYNLKLLKLAGSGALDFLPERPDGAGARYRDRQWESRLLEIAAETGLGAQFGGKYLATDARVVRCWRHAGSCPVSLGVGCSADRVALARIGPDGVFLEALDRRPERFLDKAVAVLEAAGGAAGIVRIDLDRPLAETCRQLAGCPAGTLVLLSGPVVLARDIAHARFHEALQRGEELPEYLRKFAVFYAGPAGTPPGRVIGSLGPTTAQRMDAYLPELLARGASLVTLGKGNRAPAVAEACRRFGGFFLGTIGGAAALLAQEHVMESEVLDFPELGMEAVRRVELRDLPAFVVIDNQGRSLI